MATSHRLGPNFPQNLNIHPLVQPSFNSSRFRIPACLDGPFDWKAQEQSILEYGIAGRVWEAAYAMATYIQPSENVEFDPPFFDAEAHGRYMMIELGSGSGLVASVAATFLKAGRDHFVATDLPEVCHLLEDNLSSTVVASEHELSNEPVLVVKPLSWGNYDDTVKLASTFFDKDNPRSCPEPLTHIICSDLIYFPELFGPLLRSLLHLTSPPFVSQPSSKMEPPSTTSLFISYKVRSLPKESAFWSAFGLWFTFRPVLVRDTTKSNTGSWECLGTEFDDLTFVFVAHRRPESHHWSVPVLDENLITGVGACGTDLQKSDDTFETLLVMLMEQ